MAFRLTFEIAAPMETVLDAIRADCREWRESVIPPSLRDQHVLQIAGSVSRRRFEWYYDCGGWDGCPREILRGRVEPRVDGSSTLTVWGGVPEQSLRSILAYASITAALFTLVVLIEDGGIHSAAAAWGRLKAMSFVAMTVAGVAMLGNGFRPQTDLGTSESAQYLVERIRGAIREAERLHASSRVPDIGAVRPPSS